MDDSAPVPPLSQDFIRLRGVRVHNLQGIDVDIPRGRLTWITGVSGSGKSSLAFDTLYAEGQRRFIEGFSASARQFLERIDRPDADEIDHLPPPIALRQQAGHAGTGTLSQATELNHYLRLLLAHAGAYHDPQTCRPLRAHSSESLARQIASLPAGRRFQIGFQPANLPGGAQKPGKTTLSPGGGSADRFLDRLLEQGFSRAIVAGRTVRLDRDRRDFLPELPSVVLVDRLVTNNHADARLRESLETALTHGENGCVLLWEPSPNEPPSVPPLPAVTKFPLDGQSWWRQDCPIRLIHPQTAEPLPELTPALLGSQSPLGACPDCLGRGHLTKRGQPAEIPCDTCAGTGLNIIARMVEFDGLNLPAWEQLTLAQLGPRLTEALGRDNPGDTTIPQIILPAIQNRLALLQTLDVAHLTLNRPLNTLSTGPARRVALAAAATSDLVNMLYVLDEPLAGLHPSHRASLLERLQQLRDAGNTLVAIEHDPSIQNYADWAIALGPGAGHQGGQLLFCGPVAQFPSEFHPQSPPRKKKTRKKSERLPPLSHPAQPTLTIAGCNQRNLKNLQVAFPINQLVAVAGVGGSGKSTLVVQSLYPAVRQALGEADIPCAETLTGLGTIEDVVLIDQASIGRSIRSNVVTFLNAFDAIRTAFAGTNEAQLRDLKLGAFSFNSARGGRCPHCRGTGVLTVDMQFLPDIDVSCPACHGARFRADILEVKLRGLSIAEVLALTADEAFGFFRGHNRVLRRIAPLKEVGLGYLPLGQATSTLSGGEAQRLKIASFLTERATKRTLFLFDEPTIGLHEKDVAVLLDCFKRLIAVGHSIIAIEHRLSMLHAADWIIELGPQGGAAGGEIIATGPPAHLAQFTTPTGRALAGDFD